MEPRADRSLADAFNLGAGVLGLTLLSWARFVVAKSLRVEAALPSSALIAQWVLFGACAAWSVRAAFRLLKRARSLGLQTLLRISLLLQLCAAPALPLTSSDLFCNLAYGRIAALGGNPYFAPPSALDREDPFRAAVYEGWAGYPTPYGPALIHLQRAAVAGGSLWTAIALFKLEMLIATALALLVAAALCRDDDQGATAFALFGCNPLVAWELSGQAHNDALLLLGLCGFALAARRNRWWLASLALALAVCTKPAALPVLGLVLVWQARTNPWRSLLVIAVVAVAAVGLYAPYWQGVETLKAIVRELRVDPSHQTHSLSALLYEATARLGSSWQVRLHQIWQSGAAALLAWLAIRGCRRATSLEESANGAAWFFVGYGLVAASWYQPWYVTWTLPMLLVARDARLRAVTAAWSGLSLVQYALPWHSLTPLAVDGVPLWLLWRSVKQPSNVAH